MDTHEAHAPPEPSETAAGAADVEAPPVAAEAGTPTAATPASTRPHERAGPTRRVPRVPSRAGAAAPSGAPDRPSTSRASPAVLAAIGAGLLAVVVAAGFLIGRGGGDSNDPPAAAAADSSVTTGPLKLSFPDSWQQAAKAPEIPKLRLANPLAVSERGGQAASALVAGTTNAKGPALLPEAFLKSLRSVPPRDDAVKIGALEALRYRNLQPKGYGRDLTLYVAPTTAGVVTVACTSSASDADAFLPSCERVAGNLELVAGKPLALGPDERYLATLNRTIDRLNANRRRDLRKLREATKPAAQAKAAEALARDYRQAQASLRGRSVSPAVAIASASVRDALAKTAAAYGRLADAARGGSKAGYRAAGSDIRAGERALNEALKQVYEASS